MPAQYTLTVSDYQQEVLDWLVRQTNAAQGSNLTVGQFLQLQFPSFLHPYELRYEQAMAEGVAKKYPTADAATKASVRSLLDVT